MILLEPDKVAEFARRLESENDTEAREAILSEFSAYVADFKSQFSHHYRDFMPRLDGNIGCMMDGYVRPRDRTAYIVDTRTGFIRPVDKDAQRGSRHQEVS
jgi:hypothetical protein